MSQPSPAPSADIAPQSPSLCQLQVPEPLAVVRQRQQLPFTRHLLDAAQEKLPKPHRVFDHAEHRFHRLLTQRAIESQCYVLAAAQTGHHFGRRVSFGHALIVDPWGCVIAQCGEGEGVAIAHLERDVLLRVRRQLPSLAHRKL